MIVLLVAVSLMLFVTTRVYSLDRDVVPWAIGQYSPIDEFMYVVAGFNLANHGTWMYRALPYVTDDTTPLNVMQNVATAGTLKVFGNTYHGLRMPSVLFGLGCAALVALLGARLLREARSKGHISRERAMLVALFWSAVLFFDFPFLLASRLSEPTIGRAFAVLLLLTVMTSRAALHGRVGHVRTFLVGFMAAACVFWVYLYSAFVVPTVVAVVVWRHRDDLRSLVTHGAALLAGGVSGAATYFLWVYVIYAQGPLTWYREWIAPYSAARKLNKGADRWLFDTNIFRLDRPFFILMLVCIPIVIWGMRRFSLKASVPILLMTFISMVQSLLVTDYGIRKGVAHFPLLVLVGIIASIYAEEFLRWVRESAVRQVACIVWLVASAVVSWRLIALGAVQEWSTRFILPAWTLDLNRIATVVVIGALLSLLFVRRRSFVSMAIVVLLASVLYPSIDLDMRYIFVRPTFTLRDLNRTVAATEGDAVIAGGWGYAVRLYGDVEPCEGRYLYGEDAATHWSILRRVFERGDATACYYYAVPPFSEEMEAVGLVMEESYPDVPLPKETVLARYVPASR